MNGKVIADEKIIYLAKRNDISMKYSLMRGRAICLRDSWRFFDSREKKLTMRYRNGYGLCNSLRINRPAEHRCRLVMHHPTAFG